MPARDALHYQMILMDSLAPGGILGAIVDGFERSQRGMNPPDGKPSPVEAVPNPTGLFAPSVPYDPSGDALRQYFVRHLDLALAFYVDPRMTALVTAAAETLPEDTVLRPEDLPSTHGFLLLPTGLGEIDLRGQLLIHNVVVWFQRGAGIDLWFLSNKYDDRDMMNIRQRRMFGDDGYARLPELAPAIYTRIEFGQGVPLSLGATKVLPPEITETMHVQTNPKTGQIAAMWGEGYDLTEWLGDAMEVAPNATITWIFAMWRLMQQTLTDVRTEEVDRPLRKAVRRRRMKQNTVTVITLRKRKRTEGDPESQVEYSHRFFRRGHWRQTWIGPRNGGPDERYQVPVYIHEVLVLADRDDLPILARKHVYSLER
jgi:hypothetical protein